MAYRPISKWDFWENPEVMSNLSRNCQKLDGKAIKFSAFLAKIENFYYRVFATPQSGIMSLPG